MRVIRKPSRWRLRCRQWSRAAWALSLLFATLPLANRIATGRWGFSDATAVAVIGLLLGTYFHLAGRHYSSLPDSAVLLDQAIRAAAQGRIRKPIRLLSEAIEHDPQLWQAWEYRAGLYVKRRELDLALRDLTEAIRLAPGEPHLYLRRAEVHRLAGNAAVASSDEESASASSRSRSRSL
jgi:tetratricopeptide (TPR) repeat protein